MARGGKLLIVEDEPALAEAVVEYLSDLGHDTRHAATLATARRALEEGRPDLVLLDLNLGAESGLTLLRTLRGHGIPALILSARADTTERIIGLELGADDILQKPFDLRELAARVANLLRRHGGGARALLRFERTSVDLRAALVLHEGGATTRLSAGEVALLRALAASPGRVLSRDALLDAAPAEAEDAESRSIDQRIARLRRKLETEMIRTLRGQGYVLDAPG